MDGAAGEENGRSPGHVRSPPEARIPRFARDVRVDCSPFRDLDDVLVLTDLAGEALTDIRTGQKSRHTLIAQLGQPGASTIRAISRTGTLAKLSRYLR